MNAWGPSRCGGPSARHAYPEAVGCEAVQLRSLGVEVSSAFDDVSFQSVEFAAYCLGFLDFYTPTIRQKLISIRSQILLGMLIPMRRLDQLAKEHTSKYDQNQKQAKVTGGGVSVYCLIGLNL